MKNPILRFFAVLLCSAVMLTAPTGCSTLKAVYNTGTVTVSEKTADQLIVAAETGARIGTDTLYTFIHLEKDHREAYLKISPKINELAVWLKRRVPNPYYPVGQGDPPIHLVPRGEAILSEVRIATKTFKANRTSANEANLRTAWETLKKVMADVRNMTTLATGGQP